MEDGAEKKEMSSITTVYDVTKNPMVCLQEAIRAILKCLGFESSKPNDSSSSSSSSTSTSNMSDKKEESEKEDGSEGNKQQASTHNDNNKDEPPPEDDESPQSQRLIEAATGRRGRPPSRPEVGRGPPSQNN